jgi:hypothetical protein
MIKKIKIPTNLKINFCFLNFKKYLVINNGVKNVFVLIPSTLVFTKDSEYLNFEIKSDDFLFQEFFLKILKSFEKPFRKKLVLKGLGLKVSLVENTLELKLGYSHSCIIYIPKIVNVLLNKNVIVLESFDPISLGNFAYQVKCLKFPNIYKGKGIWYKKENLVLKSIKKT